MEQTSLHMPGLDTEGGKLAAQQAMHSQYVLQLLQLQRRAGFLCDITVNIQEKSFKAHKPLLAACSLYFRALFADTEGAVTSTLNFEKLSASGFEVLLDYIYSGSLAITSENSDQVLHAANCLQMTNVVETCLNFIRSSFKVTAGDTLTKPTPSTDEKNKMPEPRIGSVPQNQPISAHMIPVALQPTVPTSENQNEFANRRLMIQNAPVSEDVTENEQHPQYHSTNIPPTRYDSVQNHGAKPSTEPTETLSLPEEGEQPTPSSQYSLLSPTSEALSMLVPYLVAKNARRPTLNEVRQLLLSGNNSTTAPENEERFAIASKPAPALIPATEVTQENQNIHHQSSIASQSQLGTSTGPHNVAAPRKRRSSSAHSSVGSNTASHTTVHAAQSYDLNAIQATSKSMQPFVLMTSTNNALRSTDVESSKSHAWSDDRSVVSDQLHDRTATHLSGTPCTANLTRTPPRQYLAASPGSFGSTPSIEISPESVNSVELQNEICTESKIKWSRAKSLDFSKHQTQIGSIDASSIPKTTEEFRSASLSPKFFRSDQNNNNSKHTELEDHSLISEELAVTAVAALYTSPEKTTSTVSSTPRLSEGSESVKADEDEKLVIDEPSGEKMDLNSGQNEDSVGSEPPNDTRDADGFEHNNMLVVKEEPSDELSVRTSPPPAVESLFSTDQEDDFSRSNSPNSSSVSNHSGTLDENGVLDLSMQKPRSAQSAIKMKLPIQNHVQFETTGITDQDAKAREALDALVMMQGAVGSNTSPTYNAPTMVPSSESHLSTIYSRKPRRSSGGQTCGWPGCGRLFRHRNIFEEHVKLHKLGVPVKQLRRCYMGARVKKTARERLDEMRMTESAASQVADDATPSTSALQRASRRKRPAIAYTKEGTERKRVTARDRKDQMHNSAWQQQGSSHATIEHVPLYAPATPSIPQAVLQAVSSNNTAIRQPWGQGHAAIPMALLNYPPTGQGIIRAPLPVMAAQVGSNNPAVVETLAALGIPIPAKRDGEEHLARVRVSNVPLSSPTSTMTLDQLRKTIALRESAAAAGETAKAAVLSQPLQFALGPLAVRAQHGTGNVTGNHSGVDMTDVIRMSTTASNRALGNLKVSVPNPYPGPNQVHGPKCS